MLFIKIVDVDQKLVSELWKKAGKSGGIYAIGDGASKEMFRVVLTQSAIVFEAFGSYFRVEPKGELLELHPIVFSHRVFAKAPELLQEIARACSVIFPGKLLCCIIPCRMESAVDLAVRAGMTYEGPATRMLSGVLVSCKAFSWRLNHVESLG
jgi:hypothetical protein